MLSRKVRMTRHCLQAGEVQTAAVRSQEAVRQLELVLGLEQETLAVRRKVAAFSLDYDDDLVTES